MLRLAPGLLLTVFGTGVLLTEYNHALMSMRPPPEYAIDLLERYSQGEVLVVIIIVVAAPLVEEFLFRGLLLRGLLALHRPAIAIPVSAAIFAAFHLNIWQLLPAFIMGLLLGWVYARTRSLLPCILGHAAWNAQWWIATALLGSPVPGYTLLHVPGDFPQQPVWWLVLGVIALVAGLRLLRKRLGDDAALLGRPVHEVAPAPRP
jgi:uncharacterized protein